jgi:uncharacterized protein (TIGR00369 family)
MNAPATRYQPKDPSYAERVRASFARQKAMGLIGARLTSVAPGATEVRLAYRDDLTQQKGYVHGGILGMIADSACGYAAYSLMPATSSLVTVEYKINILAPARGDLVARAEVIRPGRTLTVARAEVHDAQGTHVASMQQTLMTLPDTPDAPE